MRFGEQSLPAVVVSDRWKSTAEFVQELPKGLLVLRREWGKIIPA